MHTDEDWPNLPISLAHPKFLTCAVDTHAGTPMLADTHLNKQTKGTRKTALFSHFEMSYVIFLSKTRLLFENNLEKVCGQN